MNNSNSNEVVLRALFELLKPEIKRITENRSQFSFREWKYLLRTIEAEEIQQIEFELTSSRLGSWEYQIIN